MRTLIVLVYFFCLPVFSWTNHFLGTYLTFKESPEILSSNPVKVESFKAFVNKEAIGLEKLLEEIEQEAREKLENYPPRPEHLRFQANDPKNREIRVLKALRLNPEIKLALFIQELPATKKPSGKKLFATEVSVYKEDKFLDSLPIYEVKEGSIIKPIQVLSTASDEPDYGHDINLFTDTGTDFGQEYNFGTLSFGNPKYHYATQAPFHMGFFYESGIIYKLAPNFKRTYPEIRIHQFYKLAQFAFATGHEYWGYRFMGWAMHYLEDLTQPYHSTMSPGNSTPHLLWVEFKSILGFSGEKKEIIERLSDRHTAIEVYQYNFLKSLLEKSDYTHPMVKAYQEVSKDKDYPNFNIHYAREVVAKESNSRAEGLDERIGKSPYVLAFKDVKDSSMLDIKPDEGSKEINNYLIQMMNSFGSHVRNFAKFVLKKDFEKS